MQLMRLAASRTFCTAGKSRPISTAIMAMTTNSSIRVNPGERLARRMELLHYGCLYEVYRPHLVRSRRCNQETSTKRAAGRPRCSVSRAFRNAEHEPGGLPSTSFAGSEEAAGTVYFTRAVSKKNCYTVLRRAGFLASL